MTPRVTGTTWFIEGDISDHFGPLDHGILLGIMAEKIQNDWFLRLVRPMLKAGTSENGNNVTRSAEFRNGQPACDARPAERHGLPK